MGQVKFKCTADEYRQVAKIVKRAASLELLGHDGSTTDAMSTNMDLCAVHSNGCPLDFQKLMEFDDINFTHDICGIRRHINRKTGELGGCFIPRCMSPETVKA